MMSRENGAIIRLWFSPIKPAEKKMAGSDEVAKSGSGDSGQRERRALALRYF
jgi:hypothetical protein